MAGRGIGRLLGFPTANLELEDARSAPVDGVYACSVRIIGEPDAHPGTLSVGTNPTVITAGPRVVEVHLIDVERDLYGLTLDVVIVARLRDTEHFATVDELRDASYHDVERSRGLVPPR